MSSSSAVILLSLLWFFVVGLFFFSCGGLCIPRYERVPTFAFPEFPRDFFSLGLSIPLISLLENHTQHGCMNLDYSLQVFNMGDLCILLETGILNSSQGVL